VASGEVDHRLILVGDAGAPDPEGEPSLRLVARWGGDLPRRTTIAFLGDNVYETGMPDDSALEGTAIEEILDEALLNLYESRRDAEKRVNAQIDAVREAGALGVFVPGNHDWDQFGVGGWERVLTLEKYVDKVRQTSGVAVRVVPPGGCPGPVAIPLGARAELLVLNTQWWLDSGIGGKPSPEENPTRCPFVTERAVQAGLRASLEQAAREGRSTVVAAHHPLDSAGPHGGFVGWRVHLFPLRMLESYVPSPLHWLPLPGVGSLMAFGRACCSPNSQDLPSPANRRMRAALLEPMRDAARADAAPLLYAAGHDHSVQLFRRDDGPRFSLVSGLGSRAKASPVGHNRRTLFAYSNPREPSIALLDFLQDGRSRLSVVAWRVGRPRGEEIYSRFLDPASAPGARGGRAAESAPRRVLRPLRSSSSSRKRSPARRTAHSQSRITAMTGSESQRSVSKRPNRSVTPSPSTTASALAKRWTNMSMNALA
jgi:hypothetical protein